MGEKSKSVAPDFQPGLPINLLLLTFRGITFRKKTTHAIYLHSFCVLVSMSTMPSTHDQTPEIQSIKKASDWMPVYFVAERGGFEPTVYYNLIKFNFSAYMPLAACFTENGI